MPRNVEIYKYDGSNETINKYLDDEEVFVVNGRFGRRPVFASTDEEAYAIYLERFEEPNTTDCE